LRILYSHRVHSRDGQSVHIEELVTAFRKAGHEVVVVGPAFYHSASFGGANAIVGLLRRSMPRALVELAELFYSVPAFLKLRRAYRDLRPDFVYERYNLYHFAGLWLKWWYRAPFYLEINSPLAGERARFGGLGLPRLAR
jgi:hypothetical protein